MLICICLLQLGCKSAPAKKDLNETMMGHWIILYPKEELKNQKQNNAYAEIQDSLTGLKCLKLISFSANNSFNQQDSINIKGRWGTKDEEFVFVKDGGRGFDDFRTTFFEYKDEVAKLIEVVNYGDEKLKLVWHLKKIEKGDAAKLFEQEKNTWRKKAVKTESEAEIKNRLVQMLEYYSIYFKFLSEESSYFIPGRVILPFKFYQHGIGMKFFDSKTVFTSLFYSEAQAKMAHIYLDNILGDVKFDRSSNDSFTEEYSLMLNKLAVELKKTL